MKWSGKGSEMKWSGGSQIFWPRRSKQTLVSRHLLLHQPRVKCGRELVINRLVQQLLIRIRQHHGHKAREILSSIRIWNERLLHCHGGFYLQNGMRYVLYCMHIGTGTTVQYCTYAWLVSVYVCTKRIVLYIDLHLWRFVLAYPKTSSSKPWNPRIRPPSSHSPLHRYIQATLSGPNTNHTPSSCLALISTRTHLQCYPQQASATLTCPLTLTPVQLGWNSKPWP